jgi:peptide/nickel transport system substrate-binding protein
MKHGNILKAKGWTVVIASVAILFFGLQPCGADTPKYGGHLRFAYGLEASSLDPHLGRSGGDGYYWKQMFDLLVGADSSLISQPQLSLATSWETPNPKTMVFHLRKGVKFHDGTDFNAEAVKFNIERILDPATGATPRASLSVIERVEVIDPYTVKFHLKGPWGAGLSMLGDRGGAMNSPTAVKKWGKEYGFHPVGTGPFKLAEYVSGSHATFVKNENYWGKDKNGNRLPYLDKITLRIIKDPAVLAAALQAGEVDVAYINPKDVDKFRQNPKFVMKTFEGSAIGHLLVFNQSMPPMDNVNLRRAVAYAVNPQAINQSAFFGKAIVATSGMWPKGGWVFDDTVPRPYYDLKKAREYLKLGGKPNGFEMDVITWDSATLIPSTELLKAMLAQVGIKVNIKVYNVGTGTEKFFHTKEAPMFSTSWSLYPEPDWIASLCYKSDGYYNAGKTAHPEIDELVKQGASTYDVKKRKAIYRRVNEIILGDVYYVPMIYSVTYAVAPLKVQGMDTLISWDAKMVLKELWLK